MGSLLIYYDSSDTSDSDEISAVNSTANGNSCAVTPHNNGTARPRDKDDDDSDDDLEDLLKRWRRSVSSRFKPGELTKSEFIVFLRRALALVDSSEEHMEAVITALATKDGLTRLRQLTDRPFDHLNGATLNSVWRDLLLVYFKILSHDAVLESKAVDGRHDVLMSNLCGESGTRGCAVFRTAVRGLLAEVGEENLGANTHQEHVEIAIAVLSSMLARSGVRDINTDADVQKVMKSMLSLLKTPYLSNKTDGRVLSILRVLGQYRAAQDGTPLPNNIDMKPGTVPLAAGPATLPAKGGATFTLRKPSSKPRTAGTIRRLKATSITEPEAPLADSQPLNTPITVGQATHHGGHIAPRFSRHDNDKKHINNINIMPTFEEILSDERPYLPLEDASTWHKSGMHGLIDRHFRLVREDTVGQLRIAAKKELAALQSYDPIPESTSTHSVAEIQGARVNVYHDVALERVLFSEHKGVQFILTVSPPPCASHSRHASEREAWWKHEQRLGPDSLICLLSSHGGAHFLAVHNPPAPKPGKKPDANALHKRYTLGMQPGRAFIIAELVSTIPKDATALLRTLAQKCTSSKVRLALIEFPGQILQSFAPTLAALQTMSVNVADIPFADALTPDFKNFKPSSPAYSRASNFQYQLQALLHKEERGRRGLTSMDSVLKRSVLDEVQQDAVKHALTNELALIQGPPGTGKSFTGVKLIEALLENKRAANLGPIVCVCFTNHALDQLLESLLDTGVSNVIRMGFRSKSERLAPLNIREIAMNYRCEGPEGAQLGQAKKTIKQNVQDIRQHLDRWYSTLNGRSIDEDIVDDIYEVLERQLLSFYYRRSVVDEIRGEVDLRALSNADVIGVTTSGLAGKYKRLRKLRSKVVVVEEAGEVLEAHLLTAMLPSIQHAILIGDHKQLRPKVNNYDLSIDNPFSKITLDMSLFERLVSDRFDMSPGLPYTTLEMQRRMHPQISHLVRTTLYPNLKDAPEVYSYPPVAGMAKRLFWLDHRNKEDDKRNSAQVVSQSNKWEVSMVTALVNYLQKQGAYRAGEIAVLTPYSGQVNELQAKLGNSFGIMLSERDLDDGLQATGPKSRSNATIRLSTVDAFQGEEAKVVIVSMVRSNDKKICGFLATENRINVLLSRAMHGMYIIGNSHTTSEIPMWRCVVNLLKAEGNFGPALEIACRRHPNSAAPLLVREPRDFSRVSPGAGCNLECGKALSCGHLCREKCHSQAMHDRVKCKQKCGRPGEDCGHPCQKACGEDCEENCKSVLPCSLALPCGHHLTEIHCFQQYQKVSDIRCKVEVERSMLACGHKTTMACYLTPKDAGFYCREICAATLACGHSCEQDCIDCRPGRNMKIAHGPCGPNSALCQSLQAQGLVIGQLQEYKESLSTTIGQGRLLGDISLGIQPTNSAPYRSALKATGTRYTGIVVLHSKIGNLVKKLQLAGLDQEMEGHNTLLDMQVLLVRCELAIATDLVALWEIKKRQTKLIVNFSENRKYCGELLASATKSESIHQQVEAHIFWAHFLALDCAARSHKREQAAKVQERKNDALDRLAEAAGLCREIPKSSVDLAAEIEGVREMLK